MINRVGPDILRTQIPAPEARTAAFEETVEQTHPARFHPLLKVPVVVLEGLPTVDQHNCGSRVLAFPGVVFARRNFDDRNEGLVNDLPYEHKTSSMVGEGRLVTVNP